MQVSAVPDRSHRDREESVMDFRPDHRLVTPIDKDAFRRAARLRELGIKEEPDPEFDEFARYLAQTLDAPFAMVNIIGPERQYFAGLYPSSQDRGVAPEMDPFRTMACDHGYCMYVVTRKHAMAVDEVMDYHLFAGNPVVDQIGIRAYLGAPLIDPTGTLGTICVLDTKAHDWGLGGVAFIKAQAAELVERIQRRARLLKGPEYPPSVASLRI
jgi:GAF domain-containing protein